MTQNLSTDGTDVRPSHQVHGSGLTFRLADELKNLREDLGKVTAGRTAKTLSKSGNLRVTLMRLQGGVKVEPSSVAGSASLHVLEGRMRLQVDGQAQELGQGEIVILAENLKEPIEALEDCAFLLTVAWDQGAGASNQEAARSHV